MLINPVHYTAPGPAPRLQTDREVEATRKGLVEREAFTVAIHEEAARQYDLLTEEVTVAR